MNFFNFFYVYENTGFKKKWGYNRATGSLIPRKNFLCDVESRVKKIKICNVTCTLNFFFNFKNVKKKFVWILKN